MRGKKKFAPFRNESQSLGIGDLTVENRVDRVSLYGSLDLTLDKAGLDRAHALKAVLDGVVAALEAEGDALPDAIATEPTVEVKNPFES